MTKRMLSGLQVTGKSHIGNYFGAMKQFVDMQSAGHEVFTMVANLHSLTSTEDSKDLKENTLDMVKDYLAVGLDPMKITIFLQSDIAEHTELYWFFNCLVSVPFMERAVAYKDKVANGLEPNVGLFTYPVLMAADILLYSPDLVPVGADQKQHVEYARDIAQKFNNAYGETFKLPEAQISKETGIIPGIDGRKMSKSYKNHIPLFASDVEIKKICMSIVTDSALPEEKKDPEKNNIFNIYKVIASTERTEAFRKRFEEGGLSYKEAKETLAQEIIDFVSPMRAKRDSITDEEVYAVIKQGKEKAKAVAEAKMKEVYEKTGIVKS